MAERKRIGPYDAWFLFGITVVVLIFAISAIRSRTVRDRTDLVVPVETKTVNLTPPLPEKEVADPEISAGVAEILSEVVPPRFDRFKLGDQGANIEFSLHHSMCDGELASRKEWVSVIMDDIAVRFTHLEATRKGGVWTIESSNIYGSLMEPADLRKQISLCVQQLNQKADREAATRARWQQLASGPTI
jgi:hypothetical protein